MTKVVETLLGNDAFRYLSACSILFASSFNSPIPPAPQFNVVSRCSVLWSVQSKKYKNQHCFGGKGGNVTETLKNRILLPRVSTLLSPIVDL